MPSVLVRKRGETAGLSDIVPPQNKHSPVVEMRDFKLKEFVALSAILMSIVFPPVVCAATRAEQDRSVLAAVLSGTCKYMSRNGGNGFEVLDAESADVNQITDSQTKDSLKNE